MKKIKNKNIIQKVWKNKGANQKLVTIPKDSDIEEGDYVQVIKQNFNEGVLICKAEK